MAQPISEEDQLISRLEELGAEYAQLHAAEAYEQDLRQQRSQKRAIKPEPNPEEATYLHDMLQDVAEKYRISRQVEGELRLALLAAREDRQRDCLKHTWLALTGLLKSLSRVNGIYVQLLRGEADRSMAEAAGSVSSVGLGVEEGGGDDSALV